MFLYIIATNLKQSQYEKAEEDKEDNDVQQKQ